MVQTAENPESDIKEISKQEAIENSIQNLEVSIEKLEKFVDRIEDNNAAKPQTEKETEPVEPSLSNYLRKLPDVINTNGKRIESCIAKLTELLY